MKNIIRLMVSGLIALTLVLASCKANVPPTTTVTPIPSQPAATAPSQTHTPVPIVTPAPIPGTAATTTPVNYTLSTSANPPNSGAVSITSGNYTKGDRIQLNVIAYVGFGFDHWSGDIAGNNSSPILLMDSNKVLVANFVDISPPVISNVVTTNTTDTKMSITWNTNEPATSQIEYGLTSAYGSISSDKQLVSSHSLTLSGFIPNTHYFFRIESFDGAGNEGLFPVDVVTKESWMAIDYLVYVQGTTIFYNLVNDSSQTIVVTKVELSDTNGLVRHTDDSNTLEVHNIGPLAPGEIMKYSFSSPAYSNFNGWHVTWHCLYNQFNRFFVVSNSISP